jgi:hypothetical protein
MANFFRAGLKKNVWFKDEWLKDIQANYPHRFWLQQAFELKEMKGKDKSDYKKALMLWTKGFKRFKWALNVLDEEDVDLSDQDLTDADAIALAAALATGNTKVMMLNLGTLFPPTRFVWVLRLQLMIWIGSCLFCCYSWVQS